MEMFDRTIKLIGRQNFDKLQSSRVAVFGVGGVGGYVVEALVRAGVGKLLIVDKDIVDVTNLNRQIIALRSTIGQDKVDVCKSRALDINPEVEIDAKKGFVDKDTIGQFDLSQYDYIVDAVDNVTAKLLLITTAQQKGVKIISSMGTGNRLDPTKFEITDIYKTQYCKLAKVMRKELKARGIKHQTVLYSKELPPDTLELSRTPASISFVPSCAGLIIASYVVKDLLNGKE